MIGPWQNTEMHGETLPLVGLEPTVSRLEGGRDDQFRQRGINFLGMESISRKFSPGGNRTPSNWMETSYSTVKLLANGWSMRGLNSRLWRDKYRYFYKHHALPTELIDRNM